jgi:hypothetical protein
MEQVKKHFNNKPKGFKKIRGEATFQIRIMDGDRSHLFTIKMTSDCCFHTYFQVQSKVSKEVADFILRWDHSILEPVYILERDRYLMLVHHHQCYWIGFSPLTTLTLSLYQAEKVMKQIYELRHKH